jgi:hypothetical protein
LQMEFDGRPDGQRVEEGCASWLDFYQRKQRDYDTENPDAAPFALETEDCVRLLREGVQYYHRYLSFWYLDLYDLCARDTQRNLRLFAFVRAHCQEERHKMQFDQWRPYVTMMYARAVATPLVERKQYEEGLRAIESGIEAIREFLAEHEQGDRAEECAELTSLERWRDEIVSREEVAAEDGPPSDVQLLRRKLAAAVAAEEFEEAARLRDKIRGLGEPPRAAERPTTEGE